MFFTHIQQMESGVAGRLSRPPFGQGTAKVQRRTPTCYRAGEKNGSSGISGVGSIGFCLVEAPTTAQLGRFLLSHFETKTDGSMYFGHKNLTLLKGKYPVGSAADTGRRFGCLSHRNGVRSWRRWPRSAGYQGILQRRPPAGSLILHVVQQRQRTFAFTSNRNFSQGFLAGALTLVYLKTCGCLGQRRPSPTVAVRLKHPVALPCWRLAIIIAAPAPTHPGHIPPPPCGQDLQGKSFYFRRRPLRV